MIRTLLLAIVAGFLFLGCGESTSSSSPTTTTEPESKTKNIAETLTGVELVPSDFSSFDISADPSPLILQNIAYEKQKAISNYGHYPFIDFTVNDGTSDTIDVLWLDASNDKHISRISLATKSLVEKIVIPTKVNGNSGRFLGFESIGKDKFIIGYSKANSSGDEAAEAWYTAFNKDGSEIFSTLLFGEKNLADIPSIGEPAKAGSAVIRYDKSADVIALYLAHTWRQSNDGFRHQGGWFGFLDRTGDVLKDKNGKQIGKPWYVSHNFDQRMFVSSDNKFYTLWHGDYDPRNLGIAKWSHTKGIETESSYFTIPGKLGNNYTGTNTGDFTELTNGNVAIVYSTEHGRYQRDLRIAIVSGLKADAPKIAQESWLTYNPGNYVSWGSKVAQFGNNILVGWNTFIRENNQNKDTLSGSHFALVDIDGKKISKTYDLTDAILYPTQSFKKSSDGKHIIFVSGKANTLIVHMIKVK